MMFFSRVIHFDFHSVWNILSKQVVQYFHAEIVTQVTYAWPIIALQNSYKLKQDCSYQGEALNVPTAL